MKSANFSLARIFLYAIIITSLVLSLSPGMQTAVFAQSEQPANPTILGTPTPPPPHITTDAETGQVRFMGGSEEAPLALTSAADAASKSAGDVAAGFLQARGIAFGLSAGSGLSVMRETSGENGRTYERFQQSYQGVPVLGGELIVQLDANKNVISANGKVSSGLNLSVTPAVDTAAAKAAALKATSDQYPEVAAGTLAASEPELNIYDTVIFDRLSAAAQKLVWKVEVTSSPTQPLHEMVLVDAQNGEIARQYSTVEGALNRLIYYCQADYSVPGSTIKCTEDMVEGDSATLHREVYATYVALGETYKFYKDYFNRDSIDNAGKKLIAYNNISYPASDWGNAYWDGTQMFIGNGFANNDIIGHEFTHGVTANESKLVYLDQSGAINEAFSDIFGELVDLTQTKTLDPAQRWQFGEDVNSTTLHVPLANMSHPEAHINLITGNADPDPDRVSSPAYYCGFDDNGGVHKNSAVANKAAYLITDGTAGEPGGVFNGQNITGIGIPKAAKIFNYVQNNLLISTAGYPDLADALNQACTDLIGTKDSKGNLITVSDCDQVGKAILATQMNLTPCVGARGYINPVETVNLAPIGPIAYSSNILTTLSFDWRQRADATAYQLQVKDSKNQVIYQEWLPSSTACLTSRCSRVLPFALRYSEVYSWRVQTRNPLGNGPWSTAKAFKIAAPGVPGSITVTVPGAPLNTSRPTYTWPALAGASSYALRLSRIVSTSPSTVIRPYYTYIYRPETVCQTNPCSVKPVKALVPGDYKVSVVAYFGATAGPNNDTSFSVNALPGKPVINVPAPAAIVLTVEPTISWTGVTNATQYIVTMSGAAGTIPLTFNAVDVCPGGVNCSVVFPKHLEGGKLGVTVQSVSPVGKGLISTKVLFSIPKPAAPVLLTPPVMTTSRPTFVWSENPLAASYVLQLVGPTRLLKSYKANDICPIPPATGNCQVAPGVTLNPGSYTWTVKSVNKLGSIVSATGSFTAPVLAQVPSIPQLTVPGSAPLVGLVDWTQPLTLQWTKDAVATNYVLKISGPGKYARQVNLTSGACSGATCSWLFPDALVLGKYTWTVQGINLGVPGPVSKASAFTAALPAPVLNGPSGGQTLYSLTTGWPRLGSATGYNVRLVDVPTGDLVSNHTYPVAEICDATTCSARLPYGLPTSNYTVYVRGLHSTGFGLIGQSSFTFTVTGAWEFNDGTNQGWIDKTGLNDWFVTTDGTYLSNRGRQHFPGWEVTTNSVSYTDLDLVTYFQRDGCQSCLIGLVIRTTYDPQVTNAGYNGPFFLNGYQFVIMTNGRFAVRKYTAGKTEFLQKVVSTTAINTGNAWNKLRVVANGNKFGFYINNVLVWLGTDSTYTTGQIGFAMSSNDTNDNLNIDWIRRYAVPTLPALSAFGVVAPAQQALNNAANAQPNSVPGGGGQ